MNNDIIRKLQKSIIISNSDKEILIEHAKSKEPDESIISQGYVIEWLNNDEMPHTVTSSIDFGETFDSGMLMAGESFKLDTNTLDLDMYEYMCIVHPWMVATFLIDEPIE